VPRLKCTFREFVEILERNGFDLTRQAASHRRYVRVAGGRTFNVTVAFHNINDEIRPDTLASMIRQSGLQKSMFRK
jgi:predicted RNA binding protein YcfA (HicA-like mRNA interferase family)